MTDASPAEAVRRCLADAIAFHRAGNLLEADARYDQVLAIDADNVVALGYSGVLLHQRGDNQRALQRLEQAIALQPHDVEARTHLGHVLQSLGRLDEAETSYRFVLDDEPARASALNGLANTLSLLGRNCEAEQYYLTAIRSKPEYFDAMSNLGALLASQGRDAEASLWFQRALSIEPKNAAAHNHLGLLHHGQSRWSEAESAFREAIGLQPKQAAFHANLGMTLAAAGRSDESVRSLRAALELNDQLTSALVNLGRVLRARGEYDEAVTNYERALQIEPRDAEAYHGLGRTHREQGKLAEALACLRRAVELAPNDAGARNNLANALLDAGELSDAVAHYERAVEINPVELKCVTNLAAALDRVGRCEDSREWYERALRQGRGTGWWELRIASLRPPVFGSIVEMEQHRDRLITTLDRLIQKPPTASVAELPYVVTVPSLSLLYDGCDVRPLKERFSRLIERVVGEQTPPAPTNRPRLGFVVTRGHEGSFWRCMKRTVERLARDASYEVSLVCCLTGSHYFSARLDENAVGLTVLPERLDQAIACLRQESFTVLYHWEVGTDPINYLLPFFRTAPLQCTSWGVPATSGVSAVDEFLSSELTEPPGASSHYTERLRLVGGLLTRQTRPSQGAARTRSELGLSATSTIYLCSQRLTKIHPEFEEAVAKILRGDEAGRLLFFEDAFGAAARALKSRFLRRFPDVADRIDFRTRVSASEYHEIIEASDVVLDSFPCGGGLTVYDALAHAKPIVTLPSPWSRGRYAAACYQKMEFDGPVADDGSGYTELALALGNDFERRTQLEGELRVATEALFDDASVDDEYARVFGDMMERAMGRRSTSSSSPSNAHGNEAASRGDANG